MSYIVAQPNNTTCNKEPQEWTTVCIKNMHMGHEVHVSPEYIAIVRDELSASHCHGSELN